MYIEVERIFTETPKHSLWDRIEILTTFNGVKAELLRKNIKSGNNLSDEVINEKSKGIAFCVRSAKDMFSPMSFSSHTPRLTNLYYGVYNMLCALLLSDVNNNLTLVEIENFSKNGGHGLKTIYEESNNEIENSEFVYICKDGFFPNLLKYWNYETPDVSMLKNYKKLNEVPENEKDKLFSLKDLLSRIPELQNIYVEIFQEQPNYLHYYSETKFHLFEHKYIIKIPISKNSKFLDLNQINNILGLSDKYQFKRVEDRYGDYFICEEEISEVEISHSPLYNSPLSTSVTILGLKSIDDSILINFQTLYMLSIWTRYRPNLWRKVCDGEYDHLRSLFSIYIDSVERVMPNLFLNSFYGRRFIFASHSYIY